MAKKREAMSAFKVHEALVYPMIKAKLGTSPIMIPLYIKWSGALYASPSIVTFIVLNGKLCCIVSPVAEMMKSASTFSPLFISIPVSVRVLMCPVTMVALPSLTDGR